MHKYEQESRKLGKQSFMYAWVLDETGEERNRGITMDVGRFQFDTKTKHVSYSYPSKTTQITLSLHNLHLAHICFYLGVYTFGIFR